MIFNEVEKHIKTSSWSMVKLHSHSFYELYFLIEGERTFFIDNVLYTLKKDSLALIPPFTMHKTEGGPFTRININLSGSFFEKDELPLIDELCERRIINLKDKMQNQFIPMLNKLIQYQKSNNLIDRTLFKIQTKMIVADLYNLGYDNSSNIEKIAFEKDMPSIIMNIIKYIHNNYHDDITLQDISTKFFISRSYIAKLFKDYTNFTVSEYIMNMRINKAKELLLSTRKNMEEISELVGFSSANYFSLIFKKRVGLSPIKFRYH